MSNSSVQYDAGLVSKYTSDARIEHPQSMLPYVTWRRVLGDVNGLSVLDLACGDGLTSRMLAEGGARVTGVDISPAQTARAKEIERKSPLGIGYVTSDVAELKLGRMFDIVTPTFLFHYASSKEKMLRLMEVTAAHMRPGGRMVALSAAPEPIVPRLPNASHSTVWEGSPGIEGSPVRMFIYDRAGNDVCNFAYYYWSAATYLELLERAGFTDMQWISHIMPEEMREQFPNWQELEDHNGSAVLVARKK